MTTRELVTPGQPTELTPAEVVGNATIQAKLLMSIVEQTKCYQTIRDKKYLQVEAWETIGAFNRTHATTDKIEPIIREGQIVGYSAKVDLLKDGIIVGSATMPCFFTENACKGKEGDTKHKASMSAAQTFATSKAYRMNFAYVAILAGYQPLPAEELDLEDEKVVDTGKHYCLIHKVNFREFTKGKQKWWSHAIEGTEPVEWCNEDKRTKTEKPSPETPQPKDNPVEKEISPSLPEGSIDPVLLKDLLKEAKWKEENAKSYIKNVLKGEVGTGTLVEVINSLPKEKQEQFFKYLEERKSMA